MNITSLLKLTDLLAEKHSLSKPYVVGGVPRDRFLGKIKEPKEIKDVDLTTGNTDSIKLGQVLGSYVEGSKYRTYDDGHASVDIGGVRLDFSSHFIIPNIDNELKRLGVQDIDDMKRELYSRDFTINTLLEDLNFTNLYDITGKGIEDLKNGVIRCPINPELTIGHDPRRILRAIKFSIKYDFQIEPSLKKVMLEKKDSIKTLPPKFLQDKAQEIMLLNIDKGIAALTEYKLLPMIPLTKTMSDILIQKRKLIQAI